MTTQGQLFCQVAPLEKLGPLTLLTHGSLKHSAKAKLDCTSIPTAQEKGDQR
jgi:hypothetical protein